MLRELTIRLNGEDARELAHLSASVGFPPEMAAIYAIRLVSACVREGLLADVDSACGDLGPRGKVLPFEAVAKKEDSCV